MKVTDNVNKSAVIGYEKTQSMGIANTPEFVQMLSSSLYKYQKEAVVRETIANAWDAHIEQGLLTLPIQITITDELFQVKDLGLGIAPGDIQKVYGIYGQGTKENSTESTGGFGLGCKSPFAYVDTFEVISCHKGLKTIYQVTKGEGLPQIVTIGSAPTQDTGLTVSIALHWGDERLFKKNTQMIVYGGDIPCELNGSQLETLGMGRTEGEIACVNKEKIYLPYLRSSDVIIRYANMLYPIPIDLQQRALCVMKTSTSYSRQIILQAKNDAVSVQPSREGLTETPKTMNYIRGLLDQVEKRVNLEIRLNKAKYTKDLIAQIANEMQSDAGKEVFSTAITIPNNWSINFTEKGRVSYLAYEVANLLVGYKAWIQYLILDQNMGGTLIKKIKVLGTPTPTKSGLDAGVCNLIRQLRQDKLTKPQLVYKLYRKLFEQGEHVPEHTLYLKNWQGLTPLKQAPKFLFDQDLTKRKVLLCTNVKQGIDEVGYDFIVFKVKRVKGNVEKARKFLASTGYDIIGCIEPTKKKEQVTLPTNSVRKLVSNKGLMSLKSYSELGISPNFSALQHSFEHSTQTEFVAAPEYIVAMHKKNGYFVPVEEIVKKGFSKLIFFGSPNVGVSFSAKEAKKWGSKAMYLEDFMIERTTELWEEIKDDYIKRSINTVDKCTDTPPILGDMHREPELRTLLPYVPGEGETQYQYEVIRQLGNLNDVLLYSFGMPALRSHTNVLLAEIRGSLKNTAKFDSFCRKINFFDAEIMRIRFHTGSNVALAKPIIELLINQIKELDDGQNS